MKLVVDTVHIADMYYKLAPADCSNRVIQPDYSPKQSKPLILTLLSGG